MAYLIAIQIPILIGIIWCIVVTARVREHQRFIREQHEQSLKTFTKMYGSLNQRLCVLEKVERDKYGGETRWACPGCNQDLSYKEFAANDYLCYRCRNPL